MKRIFFLLLALPLFLAACGGDGENKDNDKDVIYVGVLHSLTGTMSISEIAVKDATLMAIDELNEKGGLLGKKIVPIVVDGKSDWPIFASEAEKLIKDKKVDVIFGCWTSASRKTVKPVFEANNHLLFYPVQYEGLEQSPNIVYTGAAPNQQIIPAAKWAMDKGWTKIFLIGSDYVFPRTANAIIKDQVKGLGGTIVGEEYILLGSKDVDAAIAKIKASGAQVILNTINGDTNVEFFKKLRAAGITPEKMPTISFSIAEDELRSMNVKEMVGDYAAWNYFMSIESADNKGFVERYKKKFGDTRVTDDPIEAGYFGVYLWANAVKKANTSAVGEVRKALGELSYDAPEGLVYIDGPTQHTWKAVRIGQIKENGQFDIVWSSEKPIRPVPFPDTRTREEWEKFLSDLYEGWGKSWANPGKKE
ncbi:MAG: urea ABC transporter substrate-binding protein [Bacteroidetes bacterium]|nr:urea ABC transporter substrate-binding protein [Bacteroidota bacterium]